MIPGSNSQGQLTAKCLSLPVFAMPAKLARPRNVGLLTELTNFTCPGQIGFSFPLDGRADNGVR